MFVPKKSWIFSLLIVFTLSIESQAQVQVLFRALTTKESLVLSRNITTTSAAELNNMRYIYSSPTLSNSSGGKNVLAAALGRIYGGNPQGYSSGSLDALKRHAEEYPLVQSDLYRAVVEASSLCKVDLSAGKMNAYQVMLNELASRDINDQEANQSAYLRIMLEMPQLPGNLPQTLDWSNSYVGELSRVYDLEYKKNARLFGKEHRYLNGFSIHDKHEVPRVNSLYDNFVPNHEQTLMLTELCAYHILYASFDELNSDKRGKYIVSKCTEYESVLTEYSLSAEQLYQNCKIYIHLNKDAIKQRVKRQRERMSTIPGLESIIKKSTSSVP